MDNRKLTKILRTIESCKTIEQLVYTKLWAEKITQSEPSLVQKAVINDILEFKRKLLTKDRYYVKLIGDGGK